VRMCQKCCDKKKTEIDDAVKKQKEKEQRLFQLRREGSMKDVKGESPVGSSPVSERKTFSKSSSPTTAYSFSPSRKDEDLDPQSKHKLRQQQLRIQLTLQEEEDKERERKELQATPWRPTLWSSSSERIRYRDLGYELDSAPPLPVQMVDKSKWMLDTDTVKCLDCGFRFDSVIRRHHCRACGAVFCETCSPEVGLSNGVTVRICADCYHHAKSVKRTADQEEQNRRRVVTEALRQRKNEMSA